MMKFTEQELLRLTNDEFARLNGFPLDPYQAPELRPQIHSTQVRALIKAISKLLGDEHG